MAIVKQGKTVPFDRLNRGMPFALRTVLYTRTGGREEEREYLFFKTGRNKAVTVDRITTVHILSNTRVETCIIERRDNNVRSQQRA
jgi:hypothetical protein